MRVLSQNVSRKAVLLYPPAFRKRFGAEISSLYDHLAGERTTWWVLADLGRSICRQWMVWAGTRDAVSTASESSVLGSVLTGEYPSGVLEVPVRRLAQAMLVFLLLALGMWSTGVRYRTLLSGAERCSRVELHGAHADVSDVWHR